jgi:hypothetical protein
MARIKSGEGVCDVLIIAIDPTMDDSRCLRTVAVAARVVGGGGTHPRR